MTAKNLISSAQPIVQRRTESYPARSYRVAVMQWTDQDGMAPVIHDELTALGHRAEFARCGSPIPREADLVFFFGPYGRSLPVLSLLDELPVEQRPVCIYWNTEPVPDLRLSWNLARMVGACRSRVDRLRDSQGRGLRSWAHRLLGSLLAGRMLRFRYLGDYYYAYRKGWIDIMADSSAIFARIRSEHGLPTLFVPWGATPRWYADLDLERDIDVLWMGKWGSRRRRRILDQVCRELRARGVRVHVADNVENPFVFDEERTRFLNRSKITLNLIRRWHDDNYMRFAMAVPNRSLVVSETLLPHCPYYEPGVHYVSAPVKDLANTIVYYLENTEERRRIVESAYELTTTVLTFQNSIRSVVDAADKMRQGIQ